MNVPDGICIHGPADPAGCWQCKDAEIERLKARLNMWETHHTSKKVADEIERLTNENRKMNATIADDAVQIFNKDAEIERLTAERDLWKMRAEQAQGILRHYINVEWVDGAATGGEMNDIDPQLRAAYDKVGERDNLIFELRAEIERLQAALKPFASLQDDDEMPAEAIWLSWEKVTYGDLRRARAALEGK